AAPAPGTAPAANDPTKKRWKRPAVRPRAPSALYVPSIRICRLGGFCFLSVHAVERKAQRADQVGVVAVSAADDLRLPERGEGDGPIDAVQLGADDVGDLGAGADAPADG